MKNNHLATGVSVRTRVQVGEVLLYTKNNPNGSFPKYKVGGVEKGLDIQKIPYTEVNCATSTDARCALVNQANYVVTLAGYPSPDSLVQGFNPILSAIQCAVNSTGNDIVCTPIT